jgi:hypothetical protein
MQNNSWARLLAYVTGLVNQRLLLECEYLIAENRILRLHVSGKVSQFPPRAFAVAAPGTPSLTSRTALAYRGWFWITAFLQRLRPAQW